MTSYEARFTATKSVCEAFGNYPITTLKRIANALRIPTVGSLIRCIRKEGFYGCTDDSPLYEIQINRATVSAILEDVNGCLTLYEVAKSYGTSAANYYTSLNSDADVTLAYISSKLPPDYDIADFLDELERRSERKPVKTPYAIEGYSYEGIPSSILVLTWIMLLLTGKKSGLSSSYFDLMADWHVFNPFIDTLDNIAALWKMPLKDLIVTMEHGKLELLPSHDCHAADNSKSALLKRLISKAGFADMKSFIASFPQERRASIRHLLKFEEKRLQTSTLLSLLEPFELKLSDIVE